MITARRSALPLWLTFVLGFCTRTGEGKVGPKTQLDQTELDGSQNERALAVNGPWCWWVEVAFQDLPSEMRFAAATLGWDRYDWNFEGRFEAPTCDPRRGGGCDDIRWPNTIVWDLLDDTEEDAAKTFGFTETRWDAKDHQDCVRTGPCPSEGRCPPINDYGASWCRWVNLDFQSLAQANVLALDVLGFDENTWNNGILDDDQPETWPGGDISWEELDEVEANAAEDLGFTEDRWNSEAHLSDCLWRGVCIYCPANSRNPCLSGQSRLHVLGKGETYLEHMEVGDKVLVSGATNGTYQEVYSFGHKDVYAEANFLQITTSGNEQAPLEITGEHLLMKQNSRGDVIPVRASSIEVGDLLVGNKGDPEVVSKVSYIMRNGLYSPLTKDGKIVVNGIQVSTYTAAQDQNPESIVVGNFDLISHHYLSHAAIGPFRSMCHILGQFSNFCEQRNDEGQLLYVEEGEKLISWIEKQATEIKIFAYTSLVMAVTSFQILEKLFGCFIFLCPLFGVLIHILVKQKKCKK